MKFHLFIDPCTKLFYFSKTDKKYPDLKYVISINVNCRNFKELEVVANNFCMDLRRYSTNKKY